MKKTILWTLLFLAFATVKAQDIRSLALQADEHYAQNDFADAIDGYEQVLKQEYSSAQLYYNLANAYYRNEQLGKAILNYKRALRLSPHMDDARDNLALAESRTTDRITPLPQLFLARWVQGLTKALSPRGWRVVLLIITALVGLCIVGVWVGRRRSLRKTSLLVGCGMVLLWIAALCLLLRSSRQYNAHAEGVVVAQSVSIKSSPAEQGTDIMILHEGTSLTVVDSLSGWYRIRLADGFTGWCLNDMIERI